MLGLRDPPNPRERLCATEARWSWVSPGAAFAAIAWLAGSLMLSWYVGDLEDYNKTYGTIGAAIGLLIWRSLSATIVLIGAEVNCESERQTDEETTTGPAMPIGMRGADAADRKGWIRRGQPPSAWHFSPIKEHVTPCLSTLHPRSSTC